MDHESQELKKADHYYRIIEVEIEVAASHDLAIELELRELIASEAHLRWLYHRAESLWASAGRPPSVQRESASRAFLEWLAARGGEN